MLYKELKILELSTFRRDAIHRVSIFKIVIAVTICDKSNLSKNHFSYI